MRIPCASSGRARLPGRQAAGKTGTNDDYGDAWFVGYTPELAVAVWVGYPNELRPMETEFNGEPVAGGTLPALIWKAFMTRALADEEPLSFSAPPYAPTSDIRVVFRDGKWRRDNGYCPSTRLVATYASQRASAAGSIRKALIGMTRSGGGQPLVSSLPALNGST